VVVVRRTQWCGFEEVIEAIKVRPTHFEPALPRPGIGGYCLPKDGGLGMWAYKHIFGWEDDIFRITPLAIDINDTRSLHAPQLVRDALRNMGKPFGRRGNPPARRAYREDVGDTRYSGSEIMVRKLTEMGAGSQSARSLRRTLWEFEAQDTYPHPRLQRGHASSSAGTSENLRLEKDMWAAMKRRRCDRPGRPSRVLPGPRSDQVVKSVGRPFAIIDCFCVLNDQQIGRYLELGCEVKGMAADHIKRIKDNLQKGA